MRSSKEVARGFSLTVSLIANGSPLISPGRGRTRRVWIYIATESSSMDVADWFIDSLTQRFYLLSQRPHLVRGRDEDLRPGTRSFPVGNYVILYRVDHADVLILHVVRGTRDLKRCSADPEGKYGEPR